MKWQLVLTMGLVFTFILLDILCENFLGIVYYHRPEVEATLFFLGFGLLQVVFAPIQSALSDVYGRKRMLLISLFFSFLSLGVIYLSKKAIHSHLPAFLFATLFKGICGNTLPMALALIADTRHKNYRLLFACSTGAYALAYLVLASAQSSSAVTLENRLNFYLILAFIAALVICSIILKSNKKETTYNKETRSFLSVVDNEKRLLIQDMKDTPTRRGFSAFYLWEISLYIILVSQVDFKINQQTHIAEAMMYGYLIGIGFLTLCYKFRDSTIIKIGYYTSFLSLIPYFVLFKFLEDRIFLLKSCYFFHALGNAFLSPAFLSMLATELAAESKTHEQGRRYGLADSVDTFAYICAAVILLAFSKFRVDVTYLVVTSFLFFALSWKYYDRFQTSQENIRS